MLAELERLMSDRGIGAVIVPMYEHQHSSFLWMSRGAKLTRGYVVKIAGREPLLLHYPMERDEAEAGSVETLSVHQFGFTEIFDEERDPSKAYARFYDNVLRGLGAKGFVAFFGMVPAHLQPLVNANLTCAGWKIHAGTDDLIQMARKTKEPWEVEAIRDVGRRTELVVDGVRRILRECSIDGDRVIHRGSALKIGDLKAFVRSEVARLELVEDHETILSQGRDAGVPHSRGDANAYVRPSQPIVLDIFPRDASNGYFFDLTRTFCIGPVPDELKRVHADVLDAHQRAADAIRAGELAKESQRRVCDWFEAKGYATTRSNPKTLDGYVHSLGHGVGLDVHERPFFALSESNRDAVEAGDILTIEPGLYFPDREIGVRIEDTFVIREDGRAESLSSGSRALEP